VMYLVRVWAICVIELVRTLSLDLVFVVDSVRLEEMGKVKLVFLELLVVMARRRPRNAMPRISGTRGAVLLYIIPSVPD
jgi:hypothetical protein